MEGEEEWKGRQTENKWRKECWKVRVAFGLMICSHLHQGSLETTAAWRLWYKNRNRPFVVQCWNFLYMLSGKFSAETIRSSGQVWGHQGQRWWAQTRPSAIVLWERWDLAWCPSVRTSNSRTGGVAMRWLRAASSDLTWIWILGRPGETRKNKTIFKCSPIKGKPIISRPWNDAVGSSVLYWAFRWWEGDAGSLLLSLFPCHVGLQLCQTWVLLRWTPLLWRPLLWPQVMIWPRST